MNFDEINKEYDFNFINQNNVLLVSSTDLLIYKLNSYDSKGNKQEYNYSIPDSYSAIKDSENKTLISEEEHKELVKVLLEYYKTNKDDLIDDITLIYNYTDINDISGDNSSGSNNKKGSDLLLPFLDPVEGKKD